MKAAVFGPILLCLAAALPTAAFAQSLYQSSAAASTAAAGSQPSTFWNRSYLGINIGRARTSANCNSTSMLCDDRDRSAQLYAGTMFNQFWGAELGYMDTGRMLRDGAEGRAQGLNLSLVGRTRLSSAVGVYGKFGTVYSRSESSAFGAGAMPLGSDQGFGLAYGGGVSYDFTPRLSARIEWDSHELRFNGARDNVRSTNLGLQFRY